MQKLRTCLLLVLGLASLFCSRPAMGESLDDQAIGLVMEKLQYGFLNGDDSYVIEVMYPPVLARLGGKTNFLAVLKSARSAMDEQKMQLISWDLKKPFSYVDGNGRKYAVISYQIVMMANGKRLIQSGFQLGIRGADSAWQFVNGGSLSKELWKDFFADFPKDFSLPKLERSAGKPSEKVRKILAHYEVGKTTFDQFKNDASIFTGTVTNFSRGLPLPPSYLSVNDLSGKPPSMTFYQSSSAPYVYTIYKTEDPMWGIYQQNSSYNIKVGSVTDIHRFAVGDTAGVLYELDFSNGILSIKKPIDF